MRDEKNNSQPEPHLPGELPFGGILSAPNPVVVVDVAVVVVVVSAGAPHSAVAVAQHSVGGRGQACLSQRQETDS